MYNILLLGCLILGLNSCQYAISINDSQSLINTQRNNLKTFQLLIQNQVDNVTNEAIKNRIKKIQYITINLYDRIELYYQQLSNFPTEKPSSYVSQLNIFQSEADSLQEKYLLLISAVWDNEDIKGTIGDSSRRITALQQIKRQLVPLHELRKNLVHNQQSQQNALLQLSHLQHQIKQNEYAFIHFLAHQTKYVRICGGSPYSILVTSPKPCIRLGETYKAAITLKTFHSPQLLAAQINQDNLPITNNSCIYQTKAAKVGEAAYHVTLTFTHPNSTQTITQTQAFYFETTP